MSPFTLSVDELKRLARRHFEQFHEIADGYDCGEELLKTISRDAAHHATQFNYYMDTLAKRDPNCPKDRL